MRNNKSIIKYSIITIIIIFFSIAASNIKNNIDGKSDQIDFLEKNLRNKKAQLKNIHTKLLKKNINLENLVFEDGITFRNKTNKTFKLNKINYDLKEFFSDDIIFAKHPEASSSAYIDLHDKKIFLVTATGQITYSNIENLLTDEFKFNQIKSNIKGIIKYSEFYNSSPFGVKDILIHDKKIYVSYIREHYDDCFSTSILVGNLNFFYINFEEFFTPSSCIEKKSNFYNSSEHDKMVIHQSGGRMIIVNDNLIFSTGEFRYRTLAQDLNNDFGKIISIDLINKKKKFISIGHRNPQGLYFSYDLNMLLSTEHGPSGGDEINIIDLETERTEELPNYGWPIASYGRHYHDEDNDNDPRYKLSPLKKSHLKNGFIEPIKYFTPSVGISQITGVPKKFYKSEKITFLVGTMGTAKKLKEGMISLFLFEFDKNKKKIISSQFIPIKSRVRDMIYIENQNIVLMYLETNNSLGILRKK